MKITQNALLYTMLCAFAVLMQPMHVYADQFYVASWSGIFETGTATLDVSNTDVIQSMISANQNGLAISFLTPGSYGGNQNVVYPAGDVAIAGSPLLDNDGFAFSDTNKVSYNIFYGLLAPAGYYECSSLHSNCEGIDYVVGTELTSFALTPASQAVPEPSTIWLLALGSLGLSGMCKGHDRPI